MKASLITGTRKLEVVDVPEPEARPGAAVLEVGLCGICGTDVHAYRDGHPYPPFLCGHEWFGTVLELGPDTEGPPVGERAVMGIPVSCGRCASCRAGFPNRCDGFLDLMTGRNPLTPPHGAYAPRISVPAGALVPVPDGIADNEAAQVEPATVALHAVRRRPPRLGDTAVVLGAGPIGLCTLQLARLAGATRVLVVEPREHRRSLALELGADVAMAPGDEFADAVQAATNGLGADVLYDCAGTGSSLSTAIALARVAGAVMMVGISPAAVTVDPNIWLSKELVIDSSLAHLHHEFEITMRLLVDGRLRLAPLHELTVGLDGLDGALAALADGSDHAKILVDPRLGGT